MRNLLTISAIFVLLALVTVGGCGGGGDDDDTNPTPTPTVAPSPTPTVAPSPTPTVAPSPTPSPSASPSPSPSPMPECTSPDLTEDFGEMFVSFFEDESGACIELHSTGGETVTILFSFSFFDEEEMEDVLVEGTVTATPVDATTCTITSVDIDLPVDLAPVGLEDGVDGSCELSVMNSVLTFTIISLGEAIDDLLGDALPAVVVSECIEGCPVDEAPVAAEGSMNNLFLNLIEVLDQE